MLAIFGSRMLAGNRGITRRAAFALVLVLVLTLPQFWVPIVRGQPDVGGLILVGATLIINARAPLDLRRPGALLVMGILLGSMVIFHRWYAYWALAFLCSVVVVGLLTVCRDQRSSRQVYWRLARNTAIIGLTSACWLVIFSGPAVKTMLTTDYSQVYHAYKFSSSNWEVFGRAVQYFGPAFVALSLAGLCISLRSARMRLPAVALVLQLVIPFALFSRVQDFDIHHYYLLLPSMVFLAAPAMYLLLRSGTRVGWLIRSVAAVLVTTSVLAVLTPFGQQLPSTVSLVLPSARIAPLERDDLDQLVGLGQRVADLLTRDGPKTMYVIASSPVMSDDMVASALPNSDEGRTAQRRLLRTSHVDGRDPFPQDLADADYILVATPTQYHLGPERQHVIGLLADEIRPGGSLSTYYAPLPGDIQLSVPADSANLEPVDQSRGTVQITILERTAPIPAAALQLVANQYNVLVPPSQPGCSLTKTQRARSAFSIFQHALITREFGVATSALSTITCHQ
jgi:hypothetical protein